MGKNDEKDIRIYIRPETEIVMIGGNSPVMQTIIPGSGAEDTDF